MNRNSRLVASWSEVLENRYPRIGMSQRRGTPLVTWVLFRVVRPPMTTVRLSGTVMDVVSWFDALAGGIPGPGASP